MVHLGQSTGGRCLHLLRLVNSAMMLDQDALRGNTRHDIASGGKERRNPRSNLPIVFDLCLACGRCCLGMGTALTFALDLDLGRIGHDDLTAAIRMVNDGRTVQR